MKWDMKYLGKIAFLIGFFGALVLGLLAGLKLFTAGVWLTTILIIAGIIVGLLNVKAKEEVALMVAALVIGAGAGVLATLPFVGAIIAEILKALAEVMLPAGIVIAFNTFREKAMA